MLSTTQKKLAVMYHEYICCPFCVISSLCDDVTVSSNTRALREGLIDTYS